MLWRFLFCPKPDLAGGQTAGGPWVNVHATETGALEQPSIQRTFKSPRYKTGALEQIHINGTWIGRPGGSSAQIDEQLQNFTSKDGSRFKI